MRLIDADKLLELFPLPAEPWEMRGQQYLFHVREIREIINDAPTVDTVEVVRCEDCVYHKDNDLGHWCEHTLVTFEGVCKNGKRKTDG